MRSGKRQVPQKKTTGRSNGGDKPMAPSTGRSMYLPGDTHKVLPVTQSNKWFLGATWVHNPNRLTIGSALHTRSWPSRTQTHVWHL